MIEWIEKKLALAIHDRQISEHGGTAGVRDETLLDSALARPQQLHAYGEPAPDLADLAATLTYGIARNHPFVDGNKRSAIVCCEAFIELNSAELTADDREMFPVVLALAEGKLSEAEFAAWLRTHIPPNAAPQIQDSPSTYAVSPRRRRAAP